MEINEVRILLVGSMNVGKTSIIMSLITEEFSSSTEAKIDEIIIPSAVTPEHVPTKIVDFSLQEQSYDDAREEIERANVVCIVFSLTDHTSLQEIDSTWMPLVETVQKYSVDHKPVIIVGNKCDLVTVSEETMSECYELMKKYTSIETTIHCSAVNLTNLSEIFYFAQKSVLHPTLPLLDIKSMKLTPLCEKALTRVFTICDVGKDGYLCDQELSLFQRHCFKNPLHRQGLSEIKEVISDGMDGGVTDQGVTLEGFMFLQKLFVLNGKQETTWTVLRKFGYDNTLCIKEEYITPLNDITVGSFVELSAQGIDFLSDLFYAYDIDGDGYLNFEELKNLYGICPDESYVVDDFSKCSETNEFGYPNYDAFISQYIVLAANNYNWLYGHLAIMGFELGEYNAQLAAFYSHPISTMLQAKHSSRRLTYVCKVVGPPASGKTTFMRSLLKSQNGSKDMNSSVIEGDESRDDLYEIVKHFKYDTKNYYLLIQEVDWYDTKYTLADDFYDLVIFINDESKAGAYRVIEPYFKVLSSNCTHMIVGMKNDIVNKNKKNSVIEHCKSNNLYTYKSFKMGDDPTKFSSLLNDACLISLLKKYDKKNYFQSGQMMKFAIFSPCLLFAMFFIFLKVKRF